MAGFLTVCILKPSRQLSSRAALLSASTYLYIGPETHTIIIYTQELSTFFSFLKNIIAFIVMMLTV